MQTLDSTIANVALPHMQGSAVGLAGSDRLGVDRVHRGRRDRHAPHRLDGRPLRPEARFSRLGDRLHRRLRPLRPVEQPRRKSSSARLLQGVFGAALVPMSQMVLMEINPPAKQGPAMAVWGMGVMVGPILGPTLGGWLTDSYDWRWVFFINIPVGALATYGIWRFIHPVPAARRMRFDLFGFAALSLAVGALQMLLDRGEQNDWFSSNETWVETIVMVVAFCLLHRPYGAHPRRPILPRLPAAQERQLRFGPDVHFHRRAGHVRHAGSPAHDARGSAGLSGDDHGAGDRPLRHRHHGGDDAGRAASWDGWICGFCCSRDSASPHSRSGR